MRRMSRGSAAGGSAEQVLGLLGNLHAQKEALQREKTSLVEDNISLQDQNELLMRQLLAAGLGGARSGQGARRNDGGRAAGSGR